MGIPSFFSYLIKNHPEIIKQIKSNSLKFDNFYLDSNSIVYDSLRKIKYNCELNKEFEQELIYSVCLKIDEYIQIINPRNRVFIAFDGVAPMAKLEQQRTRRYKSYFERELLKRLDTKKMEDTWDKTAITPGTEFMKKMGEFIKKYFKNSEKRLNVKQIIISTSDEVGEGEHKIFEYIRTHSHKGQTTLIYGLDADLIMLGLNHLPITKKIYLFRETPEFIKSIDSSLIPNENYILDLPLLSQTIIARMNNYRTVNSKQQTNRLYDYIFLCFFLGNDFMPHFPSMNIRTNGIDLLLNAYSEVIGKTNNNLTDGKKIYWNNVRKLVEVLSNNEEYNLKKEYGIRSRWEKRTFKNNTLEEKLMKFQHIPIKNRLTEKYIDPYSDFWQKRYYETLFNIDINNYHKRKICNNYLEGLEWTLKYYTTGCIDWKWCYKYNYPPLLSDLLIFIPHWETQMIADNNHKAVIPYVQLSYVLPKDSLHLLPYNIYIKLIKNYGHLYKNNCNFCWSFCKYFWECHVELPEINIDELEDFILLVLKNK